MENLNVKDSYLNWLKSEIQEIEIDSFHEITVPFLDRHNDQMQIYVEQTGNEYMLSDDGVILDNLRMSGINLSPKRKQSLDMICKLRGIQRNGNELFVKSTKRNIGEQLHSLIQAMLSIDDMYLTSSDRVKSYFTDDVKEFFHQNEIYYSDNVQFKGVSGLSHSYDFLFQKTKYKPERICKCINNSSKSNMQAALFGWTDTMETRTSDTQFIVILNDQNNIDSSILDGFENYKAVTVLWKDRFRKLDLFQ